MSPNTLDRYTLADRAVPASTFASIVAIAADGIVSVDAEQTIIFFNEGAEQMFGWPADEVLGQHLSVLIPPRFRGSHEGHLRGFGHSQAGARRMGERSEISGLRRNGEEFPAEASISRVMNAGQPIFTVVIRDITERKRSADRLRFLAEAGETLAGQQEMDEILSTVARLPIPSLADACVVELAHDGQTLIEAAHESDDVRAALATSRAEPAAHPTGEPHEPAWRWPKGQEHDDVPDDEALPGWLSPELRARLAVTRALHIPLRARGRTIGAFTLLRTRPWDDADRVLAVDYGRRAALALDGARLLAQVRRALHVRDDVIGIVSHDLRNPVQAVKMLAVAIGAAGERVPEHVLEHATVIRQAAEQMDRLIQDLLDAARLEAGRLSVQLRPHRVAPLVTSALEPLLPLAEARGQALTLALVEPLPDVAADAQRVAQVLSNLIGNAIKFTPEDGRIAVDVRPSGDGVIIRVTDSGPGIPEEQRERVFDRWVQLRGATSTSGAGLGLPIARGIVEAHGGRIWHEPAPGGGSVFAFTLVGLKD